MTPRIRVFPLEQRREDLPWPKSVRRGLTASYAEPRSSTRAPGWLHREVVPIGAAQVGDTPAVECENSNGSTL